jgi:hypothetical protein
MELSPISTLIAANVKPREAAPTPTKKNVKKSATERVAANKVSRKAT